MALQKSSILEFRKGTKYTSEAFQQEEKLQSIFFRGMLLRCHNFLRRPLTLS